MIKIDGWSVVWDVDAYAMGLVLGGRRAQAQPRFTGRVVAKASTRISFRTLVVYIYIYNN